MSFVLHQTVHCQIRKNTVQHSSLPQDDLIKKPFHCDRKGGPFRRRVTVGTVDTVDQLTHSVPTVSFVCGKSTVSTVPLSYPPPAADALNILSKLKSWPFSKRFFGHRIWRLVTTGSVDVAEDEAMKRWLESDQSDWG